MGANDEGGAISGPVRAVFVLYPTSITAAEAVIGVYAPWFAGSAMRDLELPLKELEKDLIEPYPQRTFECVPCRTPRDSTDYYWLYRGPAVLEKDVAAMLEAFRRGMHRHFECPDMPLFIHASFVFTNRHVEEQIRRSASR